MSSTWKVDGYIYFSIIYPKADEYTVQLEKRTSKMLLASWIPISSSISENMNG